MKKIIREDNLLSYLSLYKTSTFDLLIEKFFPKILAPQTTHVIFLSLSYFYHIKTQKQREKKIYERKPIREDNLLSYLSSLQDINF